MRQDDSLERIWEALAENVAERRHNPAGMLSIPDDVKYLDTVELARLEEAFRLWAARPARSDVRRSRLRMLLVFLLIRHTGARLGEVLALAPTRDIDVARGVARLGEPVRELQLPPDLVTQLGDLLDEAVAGEGEHPFAVDQAHVRRKFYERAHECDLAPDLANPSALRRSRAIELLRSGLPLPVVQRLLGHSTASLTAAYIDVSSEDMQRMVGHALDREQRRRTSARNAFYGRIAAVVRGDVQSVVSVQTPSGIRVASVITNDSLDNLGLRPGVFAAAEVKAPWVVLTVGSEAPSSTAGNVYPATIVKVVVGAATAEAVARLADGTEICSVLTSDRVRALDLAVGTPVWVLINVFSVILNVS